MKWIQDEEGGYINVKLAERIYIDDWGPEYTERYRVFAGLSRGEFLIKKFCALKSARGFLDGLCSNGSVCKDLKEI